MSRYTHEGLTKSRRDDIESLAYITMELVNGFLPWDDLRGMDLMTKFEEIYCQKTHTNWEEYCYDLPPVFLEFMHYATEMAFYECPRYQYWINKFMREATIRLGSNPIERNATLLSKLSNGANEEKLMKKFD